MIQAAFIAMPLTTNRREQHDDPGRECPADCVWCRDEEHETGEAVG